ncbi:carbonic anhydrase [Tsukamurella sp. 8F]|uniref:carbonic anhydrase n=1 Tax=unclassified Tsukamurella TaxID=2633480 RepID=UPI0023B91CA6|nr:MULTISPECIES: carbonic anhydrase [unclassified Tsukamurella]MDF0532195.1 carbonic anhydrase [Tsukamurella sp. 8J]MDF0589242.1 carbonic anhydrase [Tsukamurella sp. 8F]
MPRSTPQGAWRALAEGNRRFVAGQSIHPNQGASDIAELVRGQNPTVALFGCGDSRVAAEIIFDQGLGDMFVVRTAGHILDAAVIGSLEYALEILNVPLIAILGHDSCGAVAATLNTLETGELPPGYIRDIVERLTPSILQGRREGLSSVDEFTSRHVQETGAMLMERSKIISERVRDGRAAIVGLTYELAEGRVHLRGVLGDIGEAVPEPVPHEPGKTA